MSTPSLPKKLLSEAERFLASPDPGRAFIIDMRLSQARSKDTKRTYLKIILRRPKNEITALIHSSSRSQFWKEAAPWENALKRGLSWKESLEDKVIDAASKLSEIIDVPVENIGIAFESFKQADLSVLVQNRSLREILR